MGSVEFGFKKGSKNVFFLLGMALVAGLFYVAHNRGGDWHSMTRWHDGPPPWLIIGGFAVLLLTMMHLLPLLIIGAGGYAVYRVLSNGHFGAGSWSRRPMSFGMRGPGGVADIAEQGIYCPSCNAPVARNWATCPSCGYRKYVAPDLIHRRCVTCGTELQKEWKACPYCSTTITEPITAPAPGPAETRGPTSTALL